MASAGDDVKFATRVVIGVVGTVLAITVPITTAIALGNAATTRANTTRIESCVKIRTATAAVKCVTHVVNGKTLSSTTEGT